MAKRRTVRRLLLAGLTAVLLGAGTAPLAESTLPAAPLARLGVLPPCPSRAAHPPTTTPPDAREREHGAELAGAVCLAAPTEVFPARSGLPVPAPGYNHLGATSSGEWSGVLGRITVRDPGVRAGTYDFVATRFMAKRQEGTRVFWLEAGWAETGWSGAGRQRIYTYDTRRNSWTFYDQYPLRDGDQVWLYIHTEAVLDRSLPDGSGTGSSIWQAWLWWGNEWHLLVADELPLGTTAQMEQYVEVYVDPRQRGEGYPVPRVPVDNVQVKISSLGELRPWREDVPTAPGASRGRYCVDWHGRFDAWQAGDCFARAEPTR